MKTSQIALYSFRKEYLSIIIFLSFAQPAFCQVSVQGNFVAAYQQSINNDHSVQWTVGEIFTGTFTGTEFAVQSGLNEMNMQFIVTGVNEESEFGYFRVFPNPLAGKLTVETDEFFLDDAAFNFTDGSGKKFQVPVLTLQNHSVSFHTEELPAGFYILAIRNRKDNLTRHIKLIRE